jgi:peptidyl-prolyl cis-trans isomerase D
MLDFLRRNSRSWVVKVVLGVISIVFIFFLGGGGQIGSGPRAVVRVGDQDISAEAFDDAIRRNEQFYRQQYGDRLTPELLAALDIPSSTLNQLVDGAVLKQEALALGLRVPDEALRLEIREIPAFQRDGQFSPAAYRAVLERQGIGAPRFESDLREQLLIEQLVDLVRRGVHVTEEEAFEQFRRDNDELTLEYVKLPAVDFENNVVIEEGALAEWFEGRAEEYREPERIRVRYLEYDPQAFADKSAVSQEQVEEHYALHADVDYTIEEKVAARHILKKVAPDADDDARKTAREAIEAAARRIADGEDFATVAKEVSEDTSAADGGDLGSFGRGRMVAPFEEAAFALEAGQVSGVVESPFGFHLIQVYEKAPGRVKSIDEVRDEIVAQLATQGAGAAAFDAAAADAIEVQRGMAMETIAERRAMRVRSSAPFARGDIVAEVQPSPAFGENAFALSAVGSTSDAFKVGDRYYVVQLEERIDSHVPTLDEIRERVVADYRSDRAGELAREAADALLEKLRAATQEQVEDILGERRFEEVRAFTRRGSFVPGIGMVAGLKEVAFRTTADAELLPRVFTESGDAFVFRRKAAKPATREEFDERKEELLTDLRREREQQALGEFLQSKKAAARIAYNQEILGQIFK